MLLPEPHPGPPPNPKKSIVPKRETPNTYPYKGGYPGTGGRPPPPRRDRERHPRPQVRRGPEPSPLGALFRQWSLAGSAGHGPQSGPLDPAHRPGRDGGYHQDPSATLPFPRWKDHPQGPPAHPAPAPALALGISVQSGFGPVARPATPLLTMLRVFDPSSRIPNRLADARRVGVLCLSLLFALISSPFAATSARQPPPFCVCHTPRPSNSTGIKAL